MKILFNKVKPFLIAVLIFTIAAVAYFSPILEGKKIAQSDIKQFIGMAKETNDFRNENNAEPYWSNAAFSGMPTYAVSALYPYSYVKSIDKLLRFLPRPADYLFLYFLNFFILLLILKVEYKLAIVGALAFGFSTYAVIILGVGHNAKAHAIAYMPLVLAGILWVFQQQYFKGFALTAIAMALEINANHMQMTYYLLFAVLILGIFHLLTTFKEKQLPTFFKSIAILMVAVLLAIGSNATNLMATKEYANYSTRGKSELTISPDGSSKKATNGLSKSYITEYSYGILETFNLFIPRFMGGGNYENIGRKSQTFELLNGKVSPKQVKQFIEYAPMYWGKQPIVEAPAYIGSVLVFLFVLGLFLLKGTLKKWLLGVVIVSILLSWGKNLDFLTQFFINYVPLYNKFRAVSSIQVLAEMAVPLLGILTLKAFFSKDITVDQKLKALKNSVYVVGGLALFFVLFGTSLFSFESFRDGNYAQLMNGQLLEAIVSDRKIIFFNDSVRSLVLVLASALVLWLLVKEKINKNIAILAFAVLVLFDLVSIDKKYVNNSDFVIARKVDKPFVASEIDKEILKDTGYYRVANFIGSPMADGSTSYFHKSIGGYHAAKLGRYQELFDYQIAKNNIEVLNMLNTKYFVFTDASQRETVQKNSEANGNAWLVNSLKVVENANEEIMALDSLKTKEVAVINKKFVTNNAFKTEFIKDSTASIKLVSHKANQLKYEFFAASQQFAVFSEIYYKNGWNAYVDGILTPHYNVNYVLRGLLVSKGKHQITFKFEPTVIKKGNIATLTSFGLFLLIVVGWFFVERKANKKKMQ